MFKSMIQSASRKALVVALASGTTLLAGATPSLAGVGFSGPFMPSSWNLDLYDGVPVPAPSAAPPVQAPTTPTNTPTTSLPGPGVQPGGYQCSDPLNVACINDLNAAAGSMTLIGSDANGTGGSTNGQTGEAWASQWEVDPVTIPTTVSFDWLSFNFDTPGDDQSYFYVVDTSNNVTTTLLSSQPYPGDSGSSSASLLPGYRFGFGVHTATNNGGPGYLQISNFRYTGAIAVPGPLPLLGAGAAFGWSRRLRKRLSVNRKASQA